VRVITGPLEGMEGIVEQRSDGNYVVFNIESINKSIKVKLSVEEVTKVISESGTDEKKIDR
ncbi:MAG: hypothetical protein N3A61_00530, partial [Ignavibacteria bacterium]|nr:hypothetical protein [Ignavibacteria bacterium]